MNVIGINNLWKEYRLGVIGYGTLTQDIQSWWAKARGKNDPNAKVVPMLKGQEKQIDGDRFWALRDINLEVTQGEVLGIIGKNGAGKSTLLKILSRVTAPSKGSIKLRGRVASLLEVGTGFHPELTGRENVFLNGAILGMSKWEIKYKFDEIVDFSGIESFIDTPVKRYSSGMYVRLAFAVAAHLEPEILIIDEVLAVGDFAFQNKCLDKMGKVAKGGRTVLFVSHQLDMIRALCHQCVLIQDGKIILQGKANQVVDSYVDKRKLCIDKAVFEAGEDNRLSMQIRTISIADQNGIRKTSFDIYEKIIIKLEYVVRKKLQGSIVMIGIKKNDTILFWSFDTDSENNKLENRDIGVYSAEVSLPCPLLKPGVYSITAGVGIANRESIQNLEDCLDFRVEIISQSSSFLSFAEKRPGMIAAPVSWRTQST